MSGRGFVHSYNRGKRPVARGSFIPQRRLFIFVSQSLERCLARGRTRVLFKAWSGYELKSLSNEYTFLHYVSIVFMALSSITW